MEEFNVAPRGPRMQRMMELTLRPNRLKYLVILIVCTGFAVSGTLNVAKNSLIGWIEVFFFGSNVIVFGVLLLPGSAPKARSNGLHDLLAFSSAEVGLA